MFSIGQITNRFQVNNRDSEKEKERKTLNRGNYQFSEDRFPLLSDKKARNVVEHIDEYNLNIIESNRGVGGFNLIDASTESTLVQTLRTNRHTHPVSYTHLFSYAGLLVAPKWSHFSSMASKLMPFPFRISSVWLQN